MKQIGRREWLDRAVVIALGSNLAGDHTSSEALLDAALARLTELGLTVRERSSWWRSAAWPDPADPEFVNGVALIETAASPGELMGVLRGIEDDFGRRRLGANAPRTLDLDLIAHGREVFDAPGLIVPHPRAHERRFVMAPLAEIAPDWRHPVSGETAITLAERSIIGADARLHVRPPLRREARNAI
jgi:2-amino-4-hydroxy-6-hydroxymethyldihydropteridine diphosphokinase